MKTTEPALRPYLDAIEKECEALDQDSFLKLIIHLAREAAPDGRTDFLRSVRAGIAGSKGSKQKSAEVSQKQLTALLEDVEELRQEISARIRSIEDGTYWDDPDEDWDDTYYDDDPDLLNEFQLEAFGDYFATADRQFLQGNREAAGKIYQALFSVKDVIEDFGYLPDSGINFKETRARWARCVYELNPLKKKAKAILSLLDNDFDSESFDFEGGREAVLLVDIIDADSGDLDEFDQFLTLWRTTLEKRNYRNSSVARLVLEAAYMQEGINAVAGMAENWKSEQPLGYLYWLKYLLKEKKWAELRKISLKALSNLSPGESRRKAAGFLVEAGKELQDNQSVLAGFRERFLSRPDKEALLELVSEAGKLEERAEELKKVIAFLSGKKLAFGEKELLILSLLFAGDIKAVFDHCKKVKAVGWSSNPAPALLYGSILYLATGKSSEAVLARLFLEDYTRADSIYFDSDSEWSCPDELSEREQVFNGLDLVDTASLDMAAYKKWAGKIGEARVNHIVSNKYRGAYERAALVLGALAETMALEGDRDKAHALLQSYCRKRYNRHVAFRREVRDVVGHSTAIRSMADGL